MNDDTLLPFDLPLVRRKKLTVDFDGGNQSSDGGLLLLREADRRLGVRRRLAEAMPDRRDPDRGAGRPQWGHTNPRFFHDCKFLTLREKLGLLRESTVAFRHKPSHQMVGGAWPLLPLTELLGVLHDHAAPLVTGLHKRCECHL